MAYSQNRAFGESATGFLTWKQYGAVGDGVTDDTAAINACMLAADAAGKVVFIGAPEVNYLITSPINFYDGMHLYGEGITQSKIHAQGCNTFLMVDSPDVGLGATADFSMQGFWAFGDDDTSTDGTDYVGLPLVRTTRYKIDRCRFSKFTSPIQIDGRSNSDGTVYGNVDGAITNCEFVTDNTAQQKNPFNNYPGILCEIMADANGTGGPDGISFYNNRFYAEILIDSAIDTTDGATTSFSPFGAIKASKIVTADNHVGVEYYSALGGTIELLTPGVEYTIDRATLPNNPAFDFTGGSAPLGAVAAVVLLAGAGDGSTKTFRLAERPVFSAVAGGRAVEATVNAAAQTGGTDYSIADGNNRGFDFDTTAVSIADDEITLTTSQIASLNYATDISMDGTGRLVRLSTTGTLPAGLSLATNYYMVVDAVANTVGLAATYAAAVAGVPTLVNITDVGTGTHTLQVQHAIEFAAAPPNTHVIGVNCSNLRFRWIDPNADACVKLCLGAQRVSFFSNIMGGGTYGIDFDNARRCMAVDNYFQICEYAVHFGPNAGENTMPGFSARTDGTILYDFAFDESVDRSNSFDEFFASGATAFGFLFVKEEHDELDEVAARIRKTNGQLQLDALSASGSVRVGVGGQTRYIANGVTDRHQWFDEDGNELARMDGDGSMRQIGNLTWVPDASVTPANNGDLTVEATANTTLTFHLKGTDGVVRSGTLTLS